jgi:cytochrome c biogenesis protein CcmG, thiol:disulfide interchange protein DsbE
VRVSRNRFALVVLAAVALSGAAQPELGRAGNVTVGQSSPSFAIDTLDGRSITADFHGKAAYINVFATWCSPCRRELPSIVTETKRHGANVALLLVDEQEPESVVKAFMQHYNIEAGVAVDGGQFAETFGVGGLPESIFIDRHGIVRFIYRGAIPVEVLAEQLSVLDAEPQTTAVR